MNTVLALRSAACAIGILATSAAVDVCAQQKEKVAFKVSAKDSRYPQRHVLDVGDDAGHQLVMFEIQRKFNDDGPVVNGVRIKEYWSRGYGDYIDNNGLSVNYSTYVGENGDRFHVLARTLGQADGAGRRSTSSFGEIRGGTGKFAGIKGVFRAKGASEGKVGYNETNAELEYWFEK